MLKTFFSKIALIISIIFSVSVCWAENKLVATSGVAYEQLPVVQVSFFNVKSINKKVDDAQCRVFFPVKAKTVDMNAPALKFDNGVTLANQFFQEYKSDGDGFVFGHGVDELFLDLLGETVKTKMKYETVRLSNNPENVAVFYNDYCQGFFTSTWVKNKGK